MESKEEERSGEKKRLERQVESERAVAGVVRESREVEKERGER